MLASLLILAQLAAGCPSAGALEVYRLRAGCVAPIDGFLYTADAYTDNAAELRGLSVLLTEARAALSDVRTQRDTEAENAAAQAGRAAVTIRQLTLEVDEMRGRHGPLVWIAVGAGAALIIGAVALWAGGA